LRISPLSLYVHMCCRYPQCVCMVSRANQKDTETDISVLGARLAKEVTYTRFAYLCVLCGAVLISLELLCW
jgi:hypothetical protein